MLLVLAFALALLAQSAVAMPCLNQDPPKTQDESLNAMIYRGANGCEGCSESIQALLQAAYPEINVTFAGPDEEVKINAETLRDMDMYLQPGGPDLDEAWGEAKEYADDVRDFVARGGWYIGFCLGAYLAGPKNGFNLLSEGDKVVREIKRPRTQVRGTQDIVIQVDWSFTSGAKQGTTESDRWLYFQDGAAFVLPDNSQTTVLARYSHNGDVASTLNAFGKGWVANVGPHPEADQSWYDLVDVENPDGVRNDIGVDFVRAAFSAASNGTDDPRMSKLTALRDLITAGNL
ncbi:hypothetical protein QM012_005493 [Aureobasidium pullulans]|uniref:Biotin-protein ligase N-terminal domain-containing protein n=1 Tax=Aureobasidium pullulans TaxID=5580 RepID=A0ABR0T4G2_AURPU